MRIAVEYINEFSNFSLKDGNLNWNDYDLIFPIADLYNDQITKYCADQSCVLI